MRSVVLTSIFMIGLVSSLLSFCMFCSGTEQTSTIYQLQWLAAVDTAYIVTYWATYTLVNTMSYFEVTSDLYYRGIQPVLYVCFRPLFHVARSGTVWLTVLIGLSRYVAICKPFSSYKQHSEQHGKKYVKLVVFFEFSV